MKKQLLAMSLASFVAFAGFSRDFTYQGVNYTVLDETEATCETKAGVEYVSGGSNVSGALELPATPKDGEKEYKLVKIASDSFYGCYELTSVTIPEGVVSIGNNAFKACVAMTSISFPTTLTSVGEWAFYSCVELKEVELPENVNSLGAHCFRDCINLEKIQLPAGLTALPNQILDSCVKLSEVTIPEQCASIGNYALCNCKSITELVLPDALTYVGLSAFSDCTGLEKVTFGQSLQTIDENAFYNTPKLAEIVLPNSVETLNDQAFRNTGIKTLKIGKGIKTIGEEAFSGTTLKEVYITAQKPPVTANSAFGNFCDLYVEGDDAAFAYEASSLWSRFEIGTMEDPTGITGGDESVVCEPGKTVQLTAEITPATVDLPYIYWSSSDTALATVDNSGLVAVAEDVDEDGEVKITASTLYALLPARVYTVKFKAEEEPVDPVDPGEDDAVEGIADDSNVGAIYYDMTGRRIEKPAAGIYIQVSGNKASKTLIR